MIVTNLTTEQEDGIARVRGKVAWESADRPHLDLFVETKAEFGRFLWADPNAFLLASVLPAWHSKEERLLIGGPLCPLLRQNLQAVFTTFALWYPELAPPPKLDSDRGFLPLARLATRSYRCCRVESTPWLFRGHTH